MFSIISFPHGVADNMLDADIIEKVFKLKSCFWVPFWINTLRKGMNHPISPDMLLIVSLLLFFKDGFGIKETRKVNMLLNKIINFQF